MDNVGIARALVQAKANAEVKEAEPSPWDAERNALNLRIANLMIKAVERDEEIVRLKQRIEMLEARDQLLATAGPPAGEIDRNKVSADAMIASKITIHDGHPPVMPNADEQKRIAQYFQFPRIGDGVVAPINGSGVIARQEGMAFSAVVRDKVLADLRGDFAAHDTIRARDEDDA